MKKNNPLLKTVYANEDNLLDQVKELIIAGADPNERTEYFETPLRVSSRLGRFDVVKYLFESGADPSHLNWSPLFHAIAYGSLQQVRDCRENGADLTARDTWDRTPFLLAVQSGETDKVDYLLSVGADIKERGRCNQSALEYAIQMDNVKMLTFLIKQGLDYEEYNDYGYTPLIHAAENGAINCVRCLLEMGANVHKADRSQFSKKTAIAHASTIEIAELLIKAGDDINQLESEVRTNLLNLGKQDELTVSKKEYLSQKQRVYGASNPQKCKFSFWYNMVRCNAGAWKARDHFDDQDSLNDQPVWCYERFGKTITAIGKGEYVEIAGEHEDSYDPDFCIYNEVFHHKGGGDFTIYQYPKDIFPPTDFHTATLANGYIYIIGNLGYPEERDYGTTQVYRLDTKSFEIERVETSGENPGWIYNHSADLIGQSIIRIQGGEILEKFEEKEIHQFNEVDFHLDLNTLEWTKHGHEPKSGILTFFHEEYKKFSDSDKTLVAIEDDDKWKLVRVITVHRIDVAKGDEIHFEHEVLTASSDDYLFVVAYSTSKPFDSFDQLEKAVEGKSWCFENLCQVCRTTVFPKYSRYIGFSDLTEEERESFSSWKTSFEQKKAKIA